MRPLLPVRKWPLFLLLVHTSCVSVQPRELEPPNSLSSRYSTISEVYTPVPDGVLEHVKVVRLPYYRFTNVLLVNQTLHALVDAEWLREVGATLSSSVHT
jgi:hypothetical protein